MLLAAPARAQQFDAVMLDSIVKSERVHGEKKMAFTQSDKTGNYDLNYLRAEWNIDPRVYFIAGKVTYYFTAAEELSQIFFDLSDNMTVHRFMYHGLTTLNPPRPGDHTVQLDLGNSIGAGTLDSVTIFFLGKPASSGFGSFTQASHNGDSILWTLSEPYGASDWFPCKNTLTDKTDSLDIFITLPKRYIAGSIGTLVQDIALDDSLHQMHWRSRYPIVTYLVAFAATNYAVINETAPLSSGDTVLVVNYVYPEDSANYISCVVPMIQLFSERFGDYPFKAEKYGHAQWNWGGGEEHQTMSFVKDPSIYELVAHELAHQWFGDKVTCGSWQDIWLNEGFATYLAGMVYENLSPQYWYPYKLTNLVRALRDSTGSVFVSDTTDVARIFSGSLSYSKAMFLLHMLRWKLGDEPFFKALYDYVNDPELSFAFARTQDLKQHLEEESGENLDEFFNDWFYGSGYPSYHIKWANNPDGTIAVAIRQTQNHPSVSFFEMPVPLLFKNDEQDSLVRIDVNFNEGTYTVLPLGFVPDSLKFDPDLWLASTRNTVTYDSNILQPLVIFPNPVNDYLMISFHAPAGEMAAGPRAISIYDASGRMVAQYDVSTASFFDPVAIGTENFSAGFYLLELNDGPARYITRFIKY